MAQGLTVLAVLSENPGREDFRGYYRLGREEGTIDKGS